MLIKSLIQCLLVGGAVCLPVVWPEAPQSWSHTGSMVRLKATFKSICASMHHPGLLLPLPLSQRQATANAGLLMGSLFLFPGSWCAHCFVCALRASPFSPVLWKFCNQIPLSFKVGFPGFPSLCRIPRLGSLMWVGPRSFAVGEFLWYCGSSVWVTHPAGMGFDFNMIAPLLPSRCSFSFVLGHGVSFFWSKHPRVNGCSAASCDFGVPTDECTFGNHLSAFFFNEFDYSSYLI